MTQVPPVHQDHQVLFCRAVPAQGQLAEVPLNSSISTAALSHSDISDLTDMYII